MAKSIGAIADVHVIIDIGGPRPAVGYAAELAAQLGAHTTGFALAFEPLIPGPPFGTVVPSDVIAQAHEEALRKAKAAGTAFEAAMKPLGLGYQVRALTPLAGAGLAEVVEICRPSDLVVVGQSDPDRPEPMRAQLLEALLFGAGAPVLLVPYAGDRTALTGKAMVAWDGSVESARALRSAMPLLAAAREVLVVIVSEEDKWSGSVPGADIAAHLARHGLSVNVRRVGNPDNDVAATLLSIANDEQADWMVAGAYGHSRTREMLLGGVTRTLLASATVPVLMAH